MSKKSDRYFNTEKVKSDLRKLSIKGAGATVFNQVTTYGIQMIGTIILARLLTPDDFGLVAMVLAIYVFFRMFRNLGLIDATVQKEEINHQQISTLFWINTAFGLAVTLSFMALAPLIAWFYKEPQLNLITVIISLDFVFGGLSTQHRALLKRNLQIYRWSANEIGATIISVALAIMLAWHGYGYWALVAKHVVFAVVQAIGSWLICRWRPGLPKFRTGVRPMLTFGKYMIGNYFITSLTESLDKVLIGRYFGSQSLGFYHKAYHLFLAPVQQLSVPLTGVAVATLSRLSNDPEKYRHYYLNAVSMVSFVGFLISVILTLMGNDIIFILLGPQWQKAGEIFTYFSFGIGIQILYATHAWLHISLGRIDRMLRWNIFGSVITIILFLLGLQFGSLGVAAAFTASLYILIGPGLWYAGKPIDLKLSSIIFVTVKYFISAIGTGLFCWYILYSFELTSMIFFEFNIFLRILVASIFCTAVYLFLIIVIYQNTKPIVQFISVLRDMGPNILSKK